jgi:hypothetical protein
MKGSIIHNTGSAVTVRLPYGETVPAGSVIEALDIVAEVKSLQQEGFGQINTFDFRDPRTVAGVDVAFETERHMNFAPAPVSLKPEERCPDCKFGCSVCADAPGGKVRAEVASA